MLAISKEFYDREFCGPSRTLPGVHIGNVTLCDVFAQGVIQAVSKVQVNLPVIVRMAGTNVEEGQRLLTESGLKFLVADNLADTAEKVMQVLRT